MRGSLQGWSLAPTLLVGAAASALAACGNGSAGSSGSGGGEASPLTGEIGATKLASGQELTLCRTFRLGNAAPLLVQHITAELGAGSHHLILYRSADTVESPEPSECVPFGGILGGGQVPIMIAQNPHSELKWPDDVAFPIDAHQMVKLEGHFINTSEAELVAKAAVALEGVAPEQGKEIARSDIAFWGTTKISIPPVASADTGVLFQSGIAGTKAFAMTTHQHRLGTRFEVWAAGGPTADPTSAAPLADTKSWAEPPLYLLDPPLAFDGINGLQFRCEWQNTTSMTVTFGESALREMCFLWVYYYPSHGFDVCTDGTCFSR